MYILWEHPANIKDAKEDVAHNCIRDLLGLSSTSACFILGLLFNPEDLGD
jgi:hypothetical protein